MAVVVSLGKSGRVTLPAPARRALGLTEGSELLVEVADGVLTMRPAVVLTREDAWAYTSDHRERLAQARREVDAGHVYRVSEEHLKELFAARQDAPNGRMRLDIVEGDGGRAAAPRRIAHVDRHGPGVVRLVEDPGGTG